MVNKHFLNQDHQEEKTLIRLLLTILSILNNPSILNNLSLMT
jgi:hypothetical protein